MSATAATAGTNPAAPSSGRAYRFDVLADYGAFRDLQRHRLLTLEWQPLSTRHGYTEPAAIEDAGALSDWRAVMDQSADLHEAMLAQRAPRRRPLRRRHGVPGPVLHGHERPRSDARHRAAHLAAGASRVPARLPVDAPRDRRRRRPSRDRRRDAVRGSLGSGARATAVRTRNWRRRRQGTAMAHGSDSAISSLQHDVCSSPVPAEYSSRKVSDSNDRIRSKNSTPSR